MLSEEEPGVKPYTPLPLEFKPLDTQALSYSDQRPKSMG